MDAVLNLTMPTVFIDAHGSYPRTTLSVPVPAGMTIIETALPTQDTFAHIYNHLRALLFDPKPLVYLYYPKMAIDTPNKNPEHEDKTVRLQQAIIKGDYDTVIGMVGPNPMLLRKLEELEAVVQSLTVYTTGDPIYSRELSFFDEGKFDDTCSITTSDGITLRSTGGFKAAINTPDGTTSAAIIAELADKRPVKLIIMSCGHVGRGLAGFDLANAIMPIRRRFWAERDSTAGPPSTHALSEGAYSSHEWCKVDGGIKKHIKGVAPNAYGKVAATETQNSYMNHDNDDFCSSDYDTGLTEFIYVNAGGELLGDGKGDEYAIDENNPFIVTTLNKLLLTYTSIIQNLYLIDKKSPMNLVKVTDILQGLIDKEDLVLENADLINIYMGSFAKYILNSYHMSPDPDNKRAPSFSDFKEALGRIINASINTWKFSEKMQMLPVMTSLNNFKSFKGLTIIRILNENAAILRTKSNAVVLGLIGTYREYLGEDIQFWINTKLGLPFESNIELSGDPDIRAIQDQMKRTSDDWHLSMFPEENADNRNPKRAKIGGFRITRKKRSRKGRKTHARRRRSRSRK